MKPEMNDASESAKSPKRPIGVWILTVCDAAFAGALPLGGVLFAYFHADTREALVLSGFTVIATCILAGAICFAAFLAWRGDDRFRKVLLGLVSVHWGSIIYNNVNLLVSEIALQLPPGSDTRLYGNVVRSFIWLLINYWYFLGPRPVRFYAASKPA